MVLCEFLSIFIQQEFLHISLEMERHRVASNGRFFLAIQLEWYISGLIEITHQNQIGSLLHTSNIDIFLLTGRYCVDIY